MFVCALYADGCLTDCFMNNENLGAGKHPLEQEIAAKADYDEIKVFVWRDKTRLIPIADGLYLTVHNFLNCQAPQSMEFSRQKYWSGEPFLSPGDLPNSGIEPRYTYMAG